MDDAQPKRWSQDNRGVSRSHAVHRLGEGLLKLRTHFLKNLFHRALAISMRDMPESVQKNLVQLRRLLLAMGTSIGIIFFGAFGWRIWFDYHRSLLEGQGRLETLSVALAAHAESSFRAGLVVLRAMEFAIQDRGGLEAMGPSETRRVVDRAFSQFKASENFASLHYVWIADKSGSMIVDTATDSGLPQNVSDREYFKFHRATRSRETYLSPLILSRLTGKWIIPQTIRLDDPNGSFIGILGVSLRAEYLQKLYPSLGLGNDDRIALLKLDGQLLFRHPFEGGHPGSNYLESPRLRSAMGSGKGGLSGIASPFDGKPSILGFALGKEFPLVAVVTEPQFTAISRWKRDAMAYGTIGLLSYLLILAMAVYTLLKLHQLEVATHLSTHDPLTQLANRRYLDQQMPAEWKRISRGKGPFSILFLDIDFFKKYNDRYGHAEGDACLRKVADSISSVLKRGGDVLVRFGGEEFLCVLPDTDVVGARRIADSIQSSLASLAIPHEDSSVSKIVTLSIGSATAYPEPGNEWMELIHRSDEALYEAKASGRNRIAQAPPTPAARGDLKA